MKQSAANTLRPGDSLASLPAWLQPGLIATLARVVEEEVARGTARATIHQRAREAALALCPSLPRPQIAEAVTIALWVGKAEDADAGG